MAASLGRHRLQALLHRCSSGGSTMSKNIGGSLILCRSSGGMSGGVDGAGKTTAVRQQLEAAAREDRLDFFTAAKILFSTPPKPKTFGWDFHLWQFFVACLPPFAVYLTAQYSRYEMRRMEKERDEAEQLKLQAALAKQLAAESADEEGKLDELSSMSKPGSVSPAVQPEQKEDLKLKNKDEPIVSLPEKDLVSMKARLDAMEEKVRLLEAVRPGPTFIIPIGSEPNMSKGSEEKNVPTTAAQKGNSAKVGEDRLRKPAKQRNDSQLDEESRKTF